MPDPTAKPALRLHAPVIGGRTFEVLGPADPDDLVRAAIERGDTDAPYWAHLWPSALALARYLDRSSLIGPGVRVLELGCGLGLPGIVAAAKGATVTLTDRFRESVELACSNAERNGVPCAGAVYNWTGETPPPGPAPDLVIASDILYDAALHAPLARLLARLGCPALIADPNRLTADNIPSVFAAAGLRTWAAPLESGRLFTVHP